MLQRACGRLDGNLLRVGTEDETGILEQVPT